MINFYSWFERVPASFLFSWTSVFEVNAWRSSNSRGVCMGERGSFWFMGARKVSQKRGRPGKVSLIKVSW